MGRLSPCELARPLSSRSFALAPACAERSLLRQMREPRSVRRDDTVGQLTSVSVSEHQID